jgi:hypothetical protein
VRLTNLYSLPCPRKERLKNKGLKPAFALRAQLFRMTGTDLTQIDGIHVMIAATIFSDAG